MDKKIPNNSTDTVPKSKTIPSICKICGAPALYKYFGVVSCHACKVFFKRNAQIGLVSSDEYFFSFHSLFIYLASISM